MSDSLVFAKVKHHCRMPQTSYTMTPPPFYADDEPREPVTWLDIPPEGTVWQCPECNQAWRVDPSPYINVLVCHWQKITRWTYRRAVRRASR